jgi:hypothetical protein
MHSSGYYGAEICFAARVVIDILPIKWKFWTENQSQSQMTLTSKWNVLPTALFYHVLFRVTGNAACFSRNLIKIELLCSWRAVILGYAADLTFENDDDVDKYLMYT